MLLNPYRTLLEVLPGSRMLRDALSLGVVGVAIDDPVHADRVWTVMNVYAPVAGRHLGGIRARLVDQKDFVTFCNQRDLELLLGLAKPGQYCAWLDKDYPELSSLEFFGLCADEEDLDDDLLEREWIIRGIQPGVLPYGLELTRLVHLGGSRDYEEVNLMLGDYDRETGWGPDTRLETVRQRWAAQGKDKVRWSRL